MDESMIIHHKGFRQWKHLFYNVPLEACLCSRHHDICLSTPVTRMVPTPSSYVAELVAEHVGTCWCRYRLMTVIELRHRKTKIHVNDNNSSIYLLTKNAELSKMLHKIQVVAVWMHGWMLYVLHHHVPHVSRGKKSLLLQWCTVSINIHVCPTSQWWTNSSFTGCNNNHSKLNVNSIKALEINKIENIDCSNNPSSTYL